MNYFKCVFHSIPFHTSDFVIEAVINPFVLEVDHTQCVECF